MYLLRISPKVVYLAVIVLTLASGAKNRTEASDVTTDDV
jgi:hypothetical protein